jgi:glycosyltransferase involved in cell wall biosynthesis
VKVTIGIPTYNRPDWLRQSMQSVLNQSFTDFRLLVADNASDESTKEVVTSFRDDRVDYVRSAVNIGMTPNINRIIGLAKTEFVNILPDDDLLYPTYLESALAAFDLHPEAGAVHSAFDLMDEDGKVLERGRRLVKDDAPVGIERGADVIERSMRSGGIVSWTSCLFRTGSIAAAGGLRVEDEPFADGPLMMRIAVESDIAWIAESLVAVRIHGDAISAMIGSFSGERYEPDDTLPKTLHRQRVCFLDEAHLPAEQVRHYRSIAIDTYRRHTIGLLWEQIGLRRGRIETLKQLVELGRSDPRILFVPGMVKLLAALIMGRPVEFLRAARTPGRQASLEGSPSRTRRRASKTF